MSEKTERISVDEYYLKLAKDVSLRSPCKGRRQFGSVIVKDGTIISTGYNGSVRGAKNCGIDNTCIQTLKDAAHNKDYSSCCAVHSEQNAIVNAARNGAKTVGAVLYLAEANGKDDRPCYLCRRYIIQAGIETVIYQKDGKINHEAVESYVGMENDFIAEQVEKWTPKPVEKFYDEQGNIIWTQDEINAGLDKAYPRCYGNAGILCHGECSIGEGKLCALRAEARMKMIENIKLHSIAEGNKATPQAQRLS